MNYSKVNVQMSFSCSVMSDSLWPNGLHHARFPCPSPSPRVCSSSCPLSWWCHQCNIQITTWFFVCLFVFCFAFFFFLKVETCLTPMCVFVVSHVWLSATSWTVDCQAPLSTVHQIFQEKMLEWIAISYPRDLPDLGIKPMSLVSYSLSQGKSRDTKDFNVKSETMTVLIGTKIVSLF